MQKAELHPPSVNLRRTSSKNKKCKDTENERQILDTGYLILDTRYELRGQGCCCFRKPRGALVLRRSETPK